MRLCLSLALLCVLAARHACADPSLIRQSGINGGLIVQIGLGAQAGERVAALRVHEGYTVHGLDADPEAVARARAWLRQQGVYGNVSVDTFDGAHLPYVDNLVNLIIVSDGAARLSCDELLRVLTPGGVLLARSDLDLPCLNLDGQDLADGWSKYIKPVPADTDEWPHYLHGPDNNAVASDTVVGPPRHVQWVAAPEWTRNHHKLNSISASVTAQGRIFYIVDEATAANMAAPGKWALVARDAYNGALLWEKPLASWAWHKIRFRSGPPQVARLLVTDGDGVFAPLGLNDPISKLDAGSGKTLLTYERTVGAEEMVCVDGILLVLVGLPVAEQAAQHPEFDYRYQFPNRKMLLAVNTDTGQVIWEWSAEGGNPRPETLASDGEQVYLQVANGVVALDLETGKVLWSHGDTSKKRRNKLTFGQYTLVVSQGVVLCNLAGNVVAVSAESGEELWRRPAANHGFHAPLDIFVINGLVWLGAQRSDSVAPPAVNDFNQGIDLHTGAVKAEKAVIAELQTAGHHHRCYRECATTRYILTGKRGIEMMDLEGGAHFRANWVRGSCQFGIIPANGLLYAPPHSCGCYMETKLRGFRALASQRSVLTEEDRVVSDGARHQKGPAFTNTPTAPPGNGPDPASEDWPAFRHDARRSGVAATEVPPGLSQAWRADLDGALTQPVIAHGKVLVASIDEHTVAALDEQSGETAWTFTCGGRVDSPPTLFRDRVLFGSADGRVYCVGVDDGALLWRFTCSPMDVRTMAYGQLESLWPVHGSVLIHEGVVYCAAGRSTWLDDGIHLYALDPLTGDVRHTYHFRSRHPKFAENRARAEDGQVERIDQNVTDYKTLLHPDQSDSFSMAGGAIADVLVSDGQDVFLHQARFNAQLQPQAEMARHLFSTSSLLDDTENHRSHWVLGTGDFSRVPVAYSWIVNSGGARRKDTALAVPYGVMLAHDDQSVWGVHRNGKSDGKYTLFQRKHRPLLDGPKGLPDFRQSPADETPYPYVWRKALDARPRALLKAGAHIFVAVTPSDVPVNDPHAAYEGRRGGELRVFSAETGEPAAAYPLDHPVIWDGLAAANRRLYLATQDGAVACLAP